jgi:hypothetical protein
MKYKRSKKYPDMVKVRNSLYKTIIKPMKLADGEWLDADTDIKYVGFEAYFEPPFTSRHIIRIKGKSGMWVVNDVDLVTEYRKTMKY